METKVGTPINLESSVFHLGISDVYNSAALPDSVSMALTLGASIRTTSVSSHILERWSAVLPLSSSACFN